MPLTLGGEWRAVPGTGMEGPFSSIGSAYGVGQGGQVRTALIVEDEFLTSWHLSDMMSNLGFRVDGVSATGEDAIRLATDIEPDVILMDVSLKGTLDGIEAAQQILQKRPTVLVFVSAYTDDETVKRMGAVPGASRIAKPVTMTDLQTVLGPVLDDD